MKIVELTEQSTPKRFLTIKEDGSIFYQGKTLQDKKLAHTVFTNLHFSQFGSLLTEVNGETFLVEFFDTPLLGMSIKKVSTDSWQIIFQYDFAIEFSPKNFRIDSWDRFHGKTNEGIPFVLSSQAQDMFFNQLDSFTDDSITIDQEEMILNPLLSDYPDSARAEFWSEIYSQSALQNQTPNWDLEKPTPVLLELYPKLKLTKSRVLVLGAGYGHDAQFFAQNGHLVTAVDFSTEAIAGMKNRYSTTPNLKILQSDIFNLSPSLNHNFDLIFDHTCFCAINPTERFNVVKIWKSLLVENGSLMGVFFVAGPTQKPPFGSTEWEIRELMRKDFRLLHWERNRQSIWSRMGRELTIYAQKKG